MRVATLDHATDFDGWRKAARSFRQAGVAPERARFQVGGGAGGLFDEVPSIDTVEPSFVTPRAFVDLASEVILHRSADRFDLLYRLPWRLRDEPNMMRIVTD